RAAAGIKVRQPLGDLTIKGAPSIFDIEDDQVRWFYEAILKEELNIKAVWYNTGDDSLEVQLDMTMTPQLRREGLMREVVRQVQSARKDAGLQVDDRIQLVLATEDEELETAIEEHKDTIQAETLAVGLAASSQGYAYTAEVMAEGAPLSIELQANR